MSITGVLIRGSDLFDTQSGEDQNPYVTLTYGGNKWTSSTCNSGGISPEWNENINLIALYPLSGSILLECKHYNDGRDALIGKCEITLDTLSRTGVVHLEKVIKSKDGHAHGTIEINLVYDIANLAPRPNNNTSMYPSVSSPAPNNNVSSMTDDLARLQLEENNRKKEESRLAMLDAERKILANYIPPPLPPTINIKSNIDVNCSVCNTTVSCNPELESNVCKNCGANVRITEVPTTLSSSTPKLNSTAPTSSTPSSLSTLPTGQVQCDVCKTILGIPPNTPSGSQVRCPTCTNIITVGSTGGPSNTGLVGGGTGPSNSGLAPNQIQCSKCNAILGLPPNTPAGSMVKCPTANCNKTLFVGAGGGKPLTNTETSIVSSSSGPSSTTTQSQIQCNKCSTSLALPPSTLNGSQVRCPTCSNVLTVGGGSLNPSPSLSNPPYSSAPSSTLPPDQIQCSKCNTILGLPPNTPNGSQVRCPTPNCNNILTVGGAKSTSAPLSSPPNTTPPSSTLPPDQIQCSKCNTILGLPPNTPNGSQVRCPTPNCANILTVGGAKSTLTSAPLSSPSPSTTTGPSLTPGQIQCSKCTTILGLPPNTPNGSQVRCPTCANILTVGGPSSISPSSSGPSPSSSTPSSPATIQCTKCNSTLGLAPNTPLGSQVRCPTPNCNNILTVSNTGRSPTPPLSSPSPSTSSLPPGQIQCSKCNTILGLPPNTPNGSQVRCPTPNCANILTVGGAKSTLTSAPLSSPSPSTTTGPSLTPGQIQCSKCTTILGLPPITPNGSQVRCPTCANILTVGGPSSISPSSSGPSPSSSTPSSPATIQCTKCNSTLGLAPNTPLGSQVRCPTPNCNNILTVSNTGRSPTPPLSSPSPSTSSLPPGQIQCSKCNTILGLPPNTPNGSQVRCPTSGCNNILTVTGSGGPSSSPSPSTATPPNQIKCSTCATVLGLAPGTANGSQVRCPTCSAVLTVGGGAGPITPSPSLTSTLPPNQIQCNVCARILGLAPGTPGGSQVRCTCGNILTVRSSAPISTGPQPKSSLGNFGKTFFNGTY